MERLVSSAGKNLTVEAVEQTIGLGASSLVQELTEAITERDVAKGLKTLNNLTKQGTDLSQCLDQLIGYFRDLRLLAIDNSLGEQIQSPKSDLPRLKQKAEQMSVGRLSRIIKILMHTNQDIKQYGYPQLQLETALIQLNSLEEGIPLEEIINKLSALEQKFDSAGFSATETQSTPQQNIFAPSTSQPNLQSALPDSTSSTKPDTPTTTPFDPAKEVSDISHREQPTPPSSPDANAPNPSSVSHGSRDLADLPLFWETIKSKLPSEHLKHGFLEGAVPTVNGTNTVEIACSPSYLPMMGDREKKMIADTLTLEVGKPVKVELVALDTVSELVVSEEGPEETERKTPLLRRIEAQEDPQLKTALNLFDAKVVETQ